ncbi:DUF262 domain-containing HNH endonuclease family protein [Campylobacter lari]|uniref:DUF262 domain-containing protein n=1 Tax=Campylobacter lari TaxID=201 RepID=UPI002157992A|nr:DUF262 domain-containing HNH endonuclease family protein [Campylobacter lari]MCR6777866.1 DUF262 domain-containing HNH endonuclease family protein [Campylobacter lari]MCV3440730.1 DUF262 domain-containing HNH endonuclease family protein [Campylobacter lari]
MKEFEVESKSIVDIFSSNNIYKIPNYQRPYKWEDEQVEQLFDDIYEAYKNNQYDEGENYFLGSIVVTKQSSDNYEYEVIDGQQRITTLMILFCVLRDCFKNINEEYKNPDDINIQRIEQCIYINNHFQRLKFSQNPQYKNDFDLLFLNNNNNIQSFKKPSKKEIKLDDPKFKYKNTAVIIYEKLKCLLDINQDEINNFVNYLFNKVLLIKIICSNLNTAIKLFQTINDRGLDLTQLDLIKSILINKIYEENKDDLQYAKNEENSFVMVWKEIETILSKTGDYQKISMENMFTLFGYFLLGSNPKKSLHVELENQFKGKTTKEIIDEFKNFCDEYVNDLFNNNNKIVNSFWYLPWTIHPIAVIMTSLHTKYKDHLKLLILLRKFYYLYWIAGYTLSKIKQISFQLINMIKDNKDILEINEILVNKYNKDEVEKKAVENILNKDIYNHNKWIKPLLILIEYNQDDSEQREFIDLEQAHIEHILPKSYEKFYPHINKEIVDNYLNSCCNLTLLKDKKNIDAGNKPFDKKIEIYKGEGKDKKQSSFLITQIIINNYEKKEITQWNEDSMKNRRKWFCNEIEKLFSIKIKENK